MPLGLFDPDATAPYVQQAAREEQQAEPLPLDDVPPKGRLHPLALATLIGGQGFDVATTLSALANGARERNPLLGQSPARIVALKALYTLITALLADKVLAPTHPKVANGLAIGGGAIGAGAGLYNLSQRQ